MPVRLILHPDTHHIVQGIRNTVTRIITILFIPLIPRFMVVTIITVLIVTRTEARDTTIQADTMAASTMVNTVSTKTTNIRARTISI